MNKKIGVFCRSFAAAVLTVCMTFGVLATAIMPIAAAYDKPSATLSSGGGDKSLKYVSFGASNVNGYGLDGYLPEAGYENPALKNEYNTYGYMCSPEGSYTDLLVGYFEDLGYDVELSQLAMSSMRAEEVRFMFDDTYRGDAYTNWRFYDIPEIPNGPEDGQNWFHGAGKLAYEELYGVYDSDLALESAVDALRKLYRLKVADADLITYDVGANNFGVYLADRVIDGIYADQDGSDIAPDVALLYSMMKSYVLDTVNELIGEDALLALEALNVEHVADSLTYALVSYCVSFDAAIEAMYELNPDVKIVVMSIQNVMKDLVADIGIGVDIRLGELVGAMVDAANTYMAIGSPYSYKYYFADVREGGHVEFFLDEIAEYSGDPTTLDKDMRDCFDVYDEYMFLRTTVLYSLTESLICKTPESEQERREAVDELFEIYGLTPTFVTSMSGAVKTNYEPLIDAIFADGARSFETLKSRGGEHLVSLASEIYESVAVNKEGALLAAYDFAAKVMAEGAKLNTLDFAQLTDSAAFGLDTFLLLESLDAAYCAAAAAYVEYPEYYSYDAVSAKNFFEQVAAGGAAYGSTVESIKSVAAFIVRFHVGNAFYAHPSRGGHVELKNAVISALENETYGIEFVFRKVVESVTELATEYVEKAHESAYRAADEAGYVDAASAAVESAINGISSLKETLRTYGWKSDFEASVFAELDSATATLVRIKAILDNGEMATQSGLIDTLESLRAEVYIHLSGAADILLVVGCDLAEAVMEKWQTEWVYELAALIDVMKRDIIDRTAAFIAENEELCKTLAETAVRYLKQLSPELMEDVLLGIRDYIEAHPDEIIAFIIENGHYALDFARDYNELIMLAVGIAAVAFADDAAKLAKAYEDEIIDAFLHLVSEYGDEAWERIDSYLGRFEMYGELKSALKALYDTVTAAEYVKDADSYYVAIGDTLGVTGSYADIISESLDVGCDVIESDGILKEETFALLLENAETIASADLITVGYSQHTVLEYFIESLSADKSPDWESCVGADAAERIASVFDGIAADLVGRGVDAENAGLITGVVEKYFFAYVSRMTAYPEIVDFIAELAPDATVVVLGSYNGFGSLSVELYGRTVDIGAIMDCAVSAANLEAFLAAVKNENAVYVSVPGVETLFDADSDGAEATLADYISAAISGGFSPSEAGNEYIAERVLDALSVRISEELCEHEYDAICDRYCNICGYEREAEPHTYFNECDTDCNVCGAARAVTHVYTADCDTSCDICGAEREAEPHSFGEWITHRSPTLSSSGIKERVCSVCGAKERADIPMLTLAQRQDGDGSGLSVGAAVAITVCSLAVLGIGAFAAVWFGVKKKSFADLASVFKKLFGKK